MILINKIPSNWWITISRFVANAVALRLFLNFRHPPQDDLTALGKLIVALACRCLQSVHREQIQHSIDLISRHYSSDLKNLIAYLLSPNKMKSIVEGKRLLMHLTPQPLISPMTLFLFAVMPKIGARFYTHLELLENHADMVENELLKEMDNGRLYRLLVKLGSINEREWVFRFRWIKGIEGYLCMIKQLRRVHSQD